MRETTVWRPRFWLYVRAGAVAAESYVLYTVHSRVRKLQNAKVSVSNLRESSGLDFTPLFGQINFGTYSGRSMGRRVRGRGG